MTYTEDEWGEICHNDCTRSCSRSCANRDIFFSQNASSKINYKGKEHYQTCLGGCLSLLTILIVLVFLVGKSLDLATYVDSAQFTGSIYHDLEAGLGKRQASELNFDYAIAGFDNLTQEYVALDEEYIWIKAAQEVYNKSAGG